MFGNEFLSSEAYFTYGTHNIVGINYLIDNHVWPGQPYITLVTNDMSTKNL